MKHWRFVLPLLLLLLLLVTHLPSFAAERTVVLDPAASHVEFTLETTFHAVHGTLPLSGGTIRFDPATGQASGEVTAGASGAVTGNRKRDSTMHAQVLESARFPAIVFSLERIEGAVERGASVQLELIGTLTLHGDAHPLRFPATVQIEGDRVQGRTGATIPYVEWGLHDPSFLLARAEKTVSVQINFEGRIDESAGEAP